MACGHESELSFAVTGRCADDAVVILNRIHRSFSADRANKDGQKLGGKYCLLQHMQDNGCTSTANDIKIANSSTHVSTDFKGCKDGYPVKFGSHTGGHQAVHSDPGANFSWIEKETWDFFKQF